METSVWKKRTFFPLWVAFAYLVPLLFWALFIIGELPKAQGVWSLGFGWFFLAAGTLLAYFAAFLTREVAEERSGEDLSAETLEALETENRRLQAKLQETGTLQVEEYQKKMQLLNEELELLRRKSMSELEDREARIAELKEEVTRKGRQLEEKERILGQFERKVGELTYEVKSLVNLKGEEESLQEEETSDGEKILRRALDVAKKQTGAWSFQPRIGGMQHSIDNYALDQRRLYQAFSKEKEAILFFYAPSEEKVLFVNSVTKTLLGLSQEEFMSRFFYLLGKNLHSFQEALKKIVDQGQVEFTFTCRTSSGKEKRLPCLLGRVPQGVFKHHVIGVMTPF